jgi:SAM-dependent methyltransferase
LIATLISPAHARRDLVYSGYRLSAMARLFPVSSLDRETSDPSPVRILDMGCGVSATLRSMARVIPSAELTGITLVPWQIERGTELNLASTDTNRIHLVLGDYEHTPFPPASFEDVYALESSCYAHDANKSALHYPRSNSID